MSNYFETVAQIINQKQSILSELKDGENYFAHICDNQKEELLSEHQQLVDRYLLSISENLQLDHIINELINNYIDDCFEGKCNPEIKPLIKELFCTAIIFHDFGKINENFQADPIKMNNPLFEFKKSPISTTHAPLSQYLFITYYLNQIQYYGKKAEDKFILIYSILAFSYPIAKHHAPVLSSYRNEIGFEEDFLNCMTYYITKFNWDIPDAIKRVLPGRKQIGQEILDNTNSMFHSMSQEFALFGLIKLNYSLLTASDYLATAHYMNGWKKMYDQFGLLTSDRKQQIIHNLKMTQSYNKYVYDNLENIQLTCPQEPNNENLNRLRTEMAVEVIRNIRNNIDRLLFYIESPTGGGKTNLSMIALAELLAHDLDINQNNINKVFYVFPFTTLITQTYTVLKKTFGLEDNEIIELHSKAGFKDLSDDQYGKNRKCFLDNLLVNYPITVTSHVKFFDILKTNRKETNYLLHRIANSVVIIDELQSYSPDQWDKLIYLIDNYSQRFNIRFILMSATLPKIGKLTWNETIPEVISLINDKNNYFQNPNFKNRVKFDFSLLDWPKPTENEKSAYLKRLCNKVFSESKIYSNKNNHVFTIIEFIFKKTASEFYQLTAEVNNEFFDEIFVLSGTILEPRRKQIIEYLKNKDNRNNNILLITTQVVEAGVDIDMDLGFKDKSLVDSDEQLAGRINRNINKDQCVLFIFDYDKDSFIYGKDKRHETLKSLGTRSRQEYETILNEKDFDRLYDRVIDKRNTHNAGEMNIGLNDFRSYIQQLDFLKTDSDFVLIDNENCTIFAQVKIPVVIPGTEKTNFSESELNFLKEYNKYHVEDDFVDGKNVWELYKEIIQYKSEDFIDQKIRLKKMQSIFSQFTFSIFLHSKDLQNLIARGYKDHDLGIICLHDLENDDNPIYQYEFGLVTNELENAIVF